MPDVGRLEFLYLPEESSTVRVETGVRQGDDISVFYDPMIAKVIVHGEDRVDALRKLDKTLQDFNVVGVRTNIPLIRKIISTEKFRAGAVDTSFIPSNSTSLFKREADRPEDIALAGVISLITSTGKR